MNNQILEYFGNSHTDYMHARGKQSTDKFIQLLDAQDHEKILEVGFGTGATIIEIASSTKAQMFGYDVSPIMHRKALERIKFCNLSRKINIELLDKKNSFPAPDNSFDRVYAESIFAIQEGDHLKEILLEVKRVLKPNGVLLFNETLWLDTTTKAKAMEINEICRRSFGIIQSNDQYLHVSDWKNLLLELGFNIDTLVHVDKIIPAKQKISWLFLKSKLFTKAGKFKAFLSPSMRKDWKEYLQNMEAINHNQNLLEGIIIKAYNKS